MKKVYAEDAPYRNTKVSVEKSKNEIDNVLRKYGVNKIAWDFDPEHDNVELHFQFEEMLEDVTVMPVVSIRPPEIWKKVRVYSKRDSRYIKTQTVYWPQSMRCLYWYIKSHLEMTKLGYTKSAEFLPHVALHLPDGTEKKVGEILLPRLNKMNQVALKAAEVEVPKLEAKKSVPTAPAESETS